MIVVTGGAGFIGSNIVKGLNDRGIKDILVVDDLTFGPKHRNLNGLEFSDYIDYRKFIKRLYKYDFDTVIHQGACSDTTNSDGRYMMSTNYNYSKNLWNYCMRSDIRFIGASSASVYGNGDNGFIENRECEYPLNVYAFSKYMFDQYIRANFDSNSKSQTVSLRYFNVYGPQENHKNKMASVIYHFYNSIKSDKPIKLFKGSEFFIRDFVYVKDIVDINLFFFENPSISGIYNCGTGKAVSFIEVANAVLSHFEGASLEYIDFPRELEGRYQKYTQADISKLRSVGYSSGFTSIIDGVREYIKALENTDGYIV